MSSYDQEALKAETQQQLEKGADTFLSTQERNQVKRLLRFPEEFPDEFKTWMLDYVAVNVPQIPITQIAGFTQFTATVGTRVDGQSSTTSTTYVDLDGGHPRITGLGPGKYLFFHGCALESSASTVTSRQTLQFNDEAAVSDHAILSDSTSIFSASRVVDKTLTDSNNTIKCVYKVEGSGTGFFELRWLIALKYGNA